MTSSKAVTFCVVMGVCFVWCSALSLPPDARAAYDDVPARCVEHQETVSCEGAGADSLLPHPADCELFYYCVGGGAAPVCRQCPAGLHFSPAEHVCAAPEAAGCELATQH